MDFQFGFHGGDDRHIGRTTFAFLHACILQSAVSDFQHEGLLAGESFRFAGLYFETQQVEFVRFEPGATYLFGVWPVGEIGHPFQVFKSFPAFRRQSLEMLAAGKKGQVKSLEVFACTEVGIHAHDRQLLGLDDRSRRRGRFFTAVVGRQNHVGIGTAKTEGIDAGMRQVAFAFPGAVFRNNLIGADFTVVRTKWRRHLDGGRDEFVLHRQDDLDHAAHARCRQQVSHVRFDGTDQRWFCALAGKIIADAVELRDVAQRRAGGVAFEVIHGFRTEFGLFVRPFESQSLSFGIGAEQEFSFAVVRQAYAFNHRQNVVAVAHGIGQAFQNNHACTFRRGESAGTGIHGR